jgi:protein tyrosine/serine phosphatase
MKLDPSWITLFALLSLLALTAVTVGCMRSPTPGKVPLNLHNVEGNVWRSAQPQTREQWENVAKLGVKTVVKLNFEDEGSDKLAEELGLTVYELAMQPANDEDVFDNIAHTFTQPGLQYVLDAVRVIQEESARGGVLVHCTHGQDRTGLIIGVYRLLESHWTKDAAYQEMRAYGFHPELHGLHEFWEGFVVEPTH